MKRLFIILSVLIIITFAKEHSILSLETQSLPKLIHAVENAQAEIQQITIHIQLKSAINADQLQTKLDIEDKHTLEETEVIYLQDKNITFNTGSENNVGSLDIRIKGNKDITRYQELKKQLQKENIYVQDFIMITGTYDKKMSEKQMKKTTNKILKETGSKFVEGGFIRQLFLSTSAYTPQIPTYITAGSNKININVAMKYNPSENETKLIVATPLIYGDY